MKSLFKGVHLGSCAYFTQTFEQYRLGCINKRDVPLLGYEHNGGMDSEQSDNTEPKHCYVAKRPPRKIKIFDNIENSGTEILYRCVECWNCPECEKGSKIEYISIQEEIKQHLINHSVHVDIKKDITTEKLPFISNPT